MVPHVYIIIMLFFSAPGGERQEETQEKEIHQLRDGESELRDKSGALSMHTHSRTHRADGRDRKSEFQSLWPIHEDCLLNTHK